MSLEERLNTLEKKMADLEAAIQGLPDKRREDIVADISVLAHTLVGIAGKCCSERERIDLNLAREGRNFLAAAKESLFRSLENPV